MATIDLEPDDELRLIYVHWDRRLHESKRERDLTRDPSC